MTSIKKRRASFVSTSDLIPWKVIQGCSRNYQTPRGRQLRLRVQCGVSIRTRS
jgi:hypothetical protein